MFTNKAIRALTALSVWSAVGLLSAHAADTKKDEEKILGSWTIVSFEESGKKAADAAIQDTKVTFTADGKITVKRGEQVEEFTYKLDPTQKIKEFNGTNSQGKTINGIYKLEGDSLTVCFDRAGGGRPSEFASGDGTTIVLEVLKREK
jgi:uncharacterized protein (TIGR03067 family)